MGAAEKTAPNLDSMPDHSALAMFADRSHGLDRTFEAIEGMPSTSSDHFEGFVVVVTANLAFRHLRPRS